MIKRDPRRKPPRLSLDWRKWSKYQQEDIKFLGFSIGLVLLLVARLGVQPPFTIDKSADFKPLGLKGHEGCYVAEVGKGVKVSVMYGTDGKGHKEHKREG
ncbi:TPA: hypothetical protein EYP66_13260 [Candidatus Poribacteria bacterium]|nr:hypothetical protein [Candidatus Poribacteria bacterium]